MKYKINDNLFNSKKEIIEYYREILHRNKNNSLMGKDFVDVLELLYFHHKSSEKIGVGIKEIKVEYHIDPFTNKLAYHPHFEIYRHDNTNIDFSYRHAIKCINNENIIISTLKTDVKKAFRHSIREQILDYTESLFNDNGFVICEITKNVLTRDTIHIDHKYPLTFDKLVYDFMELNNLKFKDIKIEDIDGIYSIIGGDMLNEWREYHFKYAVLRPSSVGSNLSESKVQLNFDKFI